MTAIDEARKALAEFDSALAANPGTVPPCVMVVLGLRSVLAEHDRLRAGMSTADEADVEDLRFLAARARENGGRVAISPASAERIANRIQTSTETVTVPLTTEMDERL